MLYVLSVYVKSVITVINKETELLKLIHLDLHRWSQSISFIRSFIERIQSLSQEPHESVSPSVKWTILLYFFLFACISHKTEGMN